MDKRRAATLLLTLESLSVYPESLLGASLSGNILTLSCAVQKLVEKSGPIAVRVLPWQGQTSSKPIKPGAH